VGAKQRQEEQKDALKMDMMRKQTADMEKQNDLMRKEIAVLLGQQKKAIPLG
jgi:hypothetical protein